MSRRGEQPTLDLESLPPDLRKVVESALLGMDVTVARGGRELGVLTFRSTVLEGVVMPTSGLAWQETPVPEGVTVVATAMNLPKAARRRLSDEFGSDYIVLDLNEAPDTADVLLVHAVSPQLLGLLQARFPRARVLITEIQDDELGVNLTGPVSRLLEAGATAYLPPRPVSELAADVRAYLADGTLPGIGASRSAAHVPALPAATPLGR